MANEITTILTLKVAKGYLDITRSVNQQLTLTAADPAPAGMAQTIGTDAAGEEITVGDVGTLGWAWFKNLDDTNFIELGIQDGGTFFPFARLNKGEAIAMRLAQGITPFARADTAAVVLEKVIFDD